MRAWLALAGALTLLAGCAATSRIPPVAVSPAALKSWPERRADLQALQAFNLHGRVAVATGADGFNAKLRWTQTGGRTEIALDGPMGVGGVRVTSEGHELAVVTAKGERLDRAAAQAELQARLGFEPPIAQLRYWVLGVPSPAGEAHETLDADTRLVALEQDGWQIDYSDYRPAHSDIRPTRVTLTRGALRVRLIVDGWS